MLNKVKIAVDRLVLFLGSKIFFYLIIGFFLLEAAWFAFSVDFPMLYDEYTHVKVIELYWGQLNPFAIDQSASDTRLLGDVTRTTSYLFYYLMSFLYGFITNVSNSFYVHIVFLRLVCASFVATGLVVFAKLFEHAGVKRSIVNVATLIAILLPIFPYVAAHISYDNLLFLLCALYFYFGAKIIVSKKHTINTQDVLAVLAIGSLASVTKSAFLPIYVAGFTYIIIYLLNKHRKGFLRASNINPMKSTFILIVILCFVSVGLFIERYGGNYLAYGTLQPDCKQVQQDSDCSQQRIIMRNEDAANKQSVNPVATKNYVYFMKDIFIPHMIEDIGSVADGDVYLDPVPGLRYGARPLSFLLSFLWVCAAVSLICITYSWRELKRGVIFKYLFFIFVLYVFILSYLILYRGYVNKGVAYAVQPRYFMVFVLPIIVYSATAMDCMVKNIYLKFIVFFVVLIGLTQGGSIITFMVSAPSHWYWNKNIIIDVNQELKSYVSPLILDSRNVSD